MLLWRLECEVWFVMVEKVWDTNACVQGWRRRRRAERQIKHETNYGKNEKKKIIERNFNNCLYIMFVGI